MTRDELLTKLAMELAEWPIEQVGARAVAFRPVSEYVIGIDGCKAIAFSYDQYLQRRAELINKPSWDSHKWPKIVQTDDGKWFGVNEEYRMSIVSEFKGECIWIKRGEGEYLCSHQSPVWPIDGHDWRQTLERRPLSSHIKNADSFVSRRMDSEGGSPCMDCGTTDRIHGRDCPSHEWDQGGVGAWKTLGETERRRHATTASAAGGATTHRRMMSVLAPRRQQPPASRV